MLLTSLVAAVLCSGLTPDPYEDDDTAETARVVTSAIAERDHSLFPAGDEDWFTFTLDEEKLVIIESQTRNPEGIFASFEFLDSNFEQVDFIGSRVFEPFPAGTYYVRLYESDFDPEPVPHYEIFISIKDFTGDYLEPNDTSNNATPVSIGSRITGLSLIPGTDEDWFEFTVDEAKGGAPLVIDSEDPRDDLEPELFDSGDNPIIPFDGTVGVTLPPGTVRVRVCDCGFDDQFYFYNFTVWEALGPDPFEEDDTQETASLTAIDGPRQIRSLFPANDDDWVRFYGVEGEEVEVDASIHFNSSGIETYVEVYDGTGTTLLGEDVDDVQLILPADGVYLVRVSNLVTPNPGDLPLYTLNVFTPGGGPDILPGTLAGAVLDEEAMPIENAAVVLQELTGFTRTSDADGAFIFDALPQGVWTVRASAQGYTATARNVNVGSGITAETFTLEANPTDPEDLNGDNVVNAIDVQLAINGALGVGAPADVDGDDDTDAVDVQLVINAALGL